MVKPISPGSLIPDAEFRILRAVYDYSYLTREQIGRLFYRWPASRSYVRALLSWMVQQDILIRRYMYQSKPSGGAPPVYFVGRKGLQVLKAQGLPVPSRTRRSEELRR